MAITITTSSPQKLLDSIKAAIADEKIKTWSVDDDGDFTHTAQQWRYRAWLRPRVSNGKLRLTIMAPKDTAMSKATYAIYHGRFIESVLSHFDDQVDSLHASPMPEDGDIIKGS
jgi:hypothetical protein